MTKNSKSKNYKNSEDDLRQTKAITRLLFSVTDEIFKEWRMPATFNQRIETTKIVASVFDTIINLKYGKKKK